MPALLASHSRIAFPSMCHVAPGMLSQQQQPQHAQRSASDPPGVAVAAAAAAAAPKRKPKVRGDGIGAVR